MKIANVKRIAAAGAISGALGLAALGLGAGTANADESDIPFVPANPSDWQSYLPLVQSLGDVVNVADLGDLGTTGNTGSLDSLGSLGSLGSLDRGQLENLLAMLG
jgi:hypothetical protein